MALLRQEAGSAPVLLVSGFVEAADFKALDDFGKRPFFASDFFSPELLYGMPRRSIRLPNSIYSAERNRLEDIVRGLRDERRFYLVTENPDGTCQMWLLGAMSAVGRSCKALSTGSRFGTLGALRFDCE